MKDTKQTAQSQNSSEGKTRRYALEPEYHQSVDGERASRTGVVIFRLTTFVLTYALVCVVWFIASGTIDLLTIVVGLVVALLELGTVRIAQQWEKVVVLRLGKFNRVAGPGLFFTIPLLESCTLRVDTRVRTTPFNAEETLTSDLVPLNVDAVLFWHVWDAKLACLEVGDFAQAIKLAAQAALRDAIGRAGLAEVAIRRQQLDRELKGILEEKVAPWGITIMNVEVRDILVPSHLQDVMSLEAQAEQLKKARIILMEAENDISEMLVEMDSLYAEHDNALQLRVMHLLYESVRETGGTVVIPSDFAQAFKDMDATDLSKLLK